MNLLLIMPNFFDYPQTIKKELENMGYNVDFFDDRPSTNALVKAAIRINPNIIKNYIKKYFKKIMETISSKEYDVVFLISGQSLSFDEEMISEIKNKQPKAKFVLYQWDSMKNFPFIKKVHRYFDKKFSFDMGDCEDNSELVFLPLFYSDKYEKIGKENLKNFNYDFCFVGTAHPKKYKFIKMMSQQLNIIYPKQFIYFFFPSRIVYFYRKLINPEFKNAKYKEFNFVSLKGEKIEQLFRESRCILDSPQAGQNGLTIRTIEALGAKKKLITTNENIKVYDFYKEENIYIYNGNIDMENIFFKEAYVDIEKDIYEKYSIKNWLKEILK